jgi:hypothetical protein
MRTGVSNIKLSYRDLEMKGFDEWCPVGSVTIFSNWIDKKRNKNFFFLKVDTVYEKPNHTDYDKIETLPLTLKAWKFEMKTHLVIYPAKIVNIERDSKNNSNTYILLERGLTTLIDEKKK